MAHLLGVHTRTCHKCGQQKPQFGFDPKTCLCGDCRPDQDWPIVKLAQIEHNLRQIAAHIDPLAKPD